jgi:hypothetical protein
MVCQVLNKRGYDPVTCLHPKVNIQQLYYNVPLQPQIVLQLFSVYSDEYLYIMCSVFEIFPIKILYFLVLYILSTWLDFIALVITVAV